ncbi:actin interacting protein 3-domain-containing protein [Lipomyces oligophaga]|uniref:actin interacting protein 3-domain-containing protein n=1 Tax=Lipomyces oligophaga TaxID=45792 RepID=UPI0034CDEBBE
MRPSSPAVSVSTAAAAAAAARRKQDAKKPGPIDSESIDVAVTRLLQSAQKMLESLPRWASNSWSDNDVSDIYVSLGTEFNTVCRAFQHAGISNSGFDDVPVVLRVVLEDALAKPKSQQTVAEYSPKIKNIIVRMLETLKQKQALQSSAASSSAVAANAIRRTHSQAPPSPTKDYSMLSRAASYAPTSTTTTPTPTSGGPSLTSTPRHLPTPPPTKLPPNYISPGNPQDVVSVTPRSSASSRDIPVIETSPATIATTAMATARDPLVQLQRGHTMSRRASHRYSAYQFARSGGPAAAAAAAAAAVAVGGSPEIFRTPPSQTPNSRQVSVSDMVSPVEELDEMEIGPTRQKSIFRQTNTLGESALPPSAAPSAPSTPAQIPVPFPGSTTRSNSINHPLPPAPVRNVIFLKLQDRVKKVHLDIFPTTVASLRLLFVEQFGYNPGTENFPALLLLDKTTGIAYELDDSTIADVVSGSVVILKADSEIEGKQAIEKAVADLAKQFDVLKNLVAQQSLDLTKIVETQKSGAELVQESMDALKESVRTAVEGVERKSHLDPAVTDKSIGPTVIVPENPDSTETAVHALTEPSVAPVAASTALAPITAAEIKSLRTELTSLHKIQTTFRKDFQNQLGSIKSKITGSFGSSTTNITVNGHTQITAYHNTLGGDVDNLLTRVDDLQDVVEALRIDVAKRMVRPFPRELDAISHQLAVSRTELRRLDTYIKTEKPTWKKILEAELDVIVDEQGFFTLQEDLLADLHDDLDATAETFSLLQQVLDEQSRNSSSRPRTPGLPTSDLASSNNATSGGFTRDAVLAEVRTLQPNHEDRVEAIGRAEKIRALELTTRPKDPFEVELHEYVEENKLKDTGGVEAVEKQRLDREEKARLAWIEAAMEMGI